MGESFDTFDRDTGDRTAFGYADAFRAAGKQNALGFSFFHPMAIAEQAAAIQIGTRKARGIIPAIKTLPLINMDYWKGVSTGGWELLSPKNRALAEKLGIRRYDPPPYSEPRRSLSLDAVGNAGISLETRDAERVITSTMQRLHFENPVLEHTVGMAARGLGNIHYVMNRALWDFYLPAMQLLSYETILKHEMLLKPNRTEAEVAFLKRDIGTHVNQISGTENLEAMLLHPKAQQLANFAMFAPVWSLSNFRVLTNGFHSETGHRLTGRWLGGAAFTWFVTANLANMATTGWVYSGQDGPAKDKNGVPRAHGIWDNPGIPMDFWSRKTEEITENAVGIYSGVNPDGTESYFISHKAFLEPLQFALAPFKFATSRLSLPLKLAIAATTGHQAGTGYPVYDPNATPGEKAVQVGMMLTDTGATPFITEDLKKRAFRALFPESVPEPGASQAYFPHTKIPLPFVAHRGLSPARAFEGYLAAMRAHDDHLADFILKMAVQNNINPRQIVRRYRTEMRRRANILAGPRQTYDVYGGEVPPTSR
jgi:hypothetical protein